MTFPTSTRLTIPPVMSIQIEDTMDVMIARSTARRAAGLLGFAASSRAQIATAVAVLAPSPGKTVDYTLSDCALSLYQQMPGGRPPQ